MSKPMETAPMMDLNLHDMEGMEEADVGRIRSRQAALDVRRILPYSAADQWSGDLYE